MLSILLPHKRNLDRQRELPVVQVPHRVMHPKAHSNGIQKKKKNIGHSSSL